MPQSNDINFVSIANWNEYLSLVKNDHDNLSKVVNPNNWGEHGNKPVCHRINAKKRLDDRLKDENSKTGQKVDQKNKFKNRNDSTENSCNKIDTSYFLLEQANSKVSKKFLPNPSIGVNCLRRMCSSCPRTTLFYKSHMNQAGKQVNVKPTEKDWMVYAQKVWEDLLNSSFYSEFRYFEFNDYS